MTRFFMINPMLEVGFPLNHILPLRGKRRLGNPHRWRARAGQVATGCLPRSSKSTHFFSMGE